jgi:hypothetical protein
MLLLILSFVAGLITDFIWTKLVLCINCKNGFWAANWNVLLCLCGIYSTYLVIDQNYWAIGLFLLGGWIGTYLCVIDSDDSKTDKCPDGVYNNKETIENKVTMTSFLSRIFQIFISFLKSIFDFPPEPVRYLSWSLTQMHAQVRIFWTPSVSQDVKDVEFLVVANGTEVVRETLAPSVSEKIVDLKEGENIEVTVTVNDGTYKVPAHLNFIMPDLELPQGVQNLGYEIVHVHDHDEEPEPTPEPVPEPPVV